MGLKSLFQHLKFVAQPEVIQQMQPSKVLGFIASFGKVLIDAVFYDKHHIYLTPQSTKTTYRIVETRPCSGSETMLHIFLKSTGPMSTDDIGPYEMELESGQLFMRLALAAYANLEVPITHPQAVLGPVIAAKRVTTNLGLWKFTDRKLSMDYNNMMINFSVCSTQRPSIFQLFWHLTDTLEFNPLSPENTYCEPVVLYTYQGLDEWANGLGV